MIRGKLFDFEEVCDGFDCGAVGGIDLYIGCKIFFFYLITSTYSTKSSSKYKYLNYNNHLFRMKNNKMHFCKAVPKHQQVSN